MSGSGISDIRAYIFLKKDGIPKIGRKKASRKKNYARNIERSVPIYSIEDSITMRFPISGIRDLKAGTIRHIGVTGMSVASGSPRQAIWTGFDRKIPHHLAATTEVR